MSLDPKADAEEEITWREFGRLIIRICAPVALMVLCILIADLTRGPDPLDHFLRLALLLVSMTIGVLALFSVVYVLICEWLER